MGKIRSTRNEQVNSRAQYCSSAKRRTWSSLSQLVVLCALRDCRMWWHATFMITPLKTKAARCYFYYYRALNSVDCDYSSCKCRRKTPSWLPTILFARAFANGCTPSFFHSSVAKTYYIMSHLCKPYALGVKLVWKTVVGRTHRFLKSLR